MSAGIHKRNVSKETKTEIRESSGCSYCGDYLEPLVVDHYRPLSRGGGNDRDNLRAACVSCNSQKRAMLFHEWRMYRQNAGMPWPPVATHATDAVHYKDQCKQCSDAWNSLDSGVSHLFICVPYNMRPSDSGRGCVFYYACPMGHTWTCWYAFSKGYYSDCLCTFCQVARDDNGDKTWPPLDLYVDGSAQHEDLARVAGFRHIPLRERVLNIHDLHNLDY